MFVVSTRVKSRFQVETYIVHFADRLIAGIWKCGNPVCAGIDPRPQSLPQGFLEGFTPDPVGVATAIRVFGKGVVDVVAKLIPVVKFQAAFYEALGPEGSKALQETARHARKQGMIVIFDGKRNDIGSTAEAYANAYLSVDEQRAGDEASSAWEVDAITINTYLGSDGVNPFLEAAGHSEKGVFALVRTSNPSAVEFQDIVADGKPLYRHVADRVVDWAERYRDSSGYSLLGAVVGATYPEQLAELRSTMPGIFFLVPGYGAQGGSAADVAPAFNDQGLGAIVNNSRGLVFAYNRPELREKYHGDWQRAIEHAAHEMIADLAEHTHARRLRSPGD